eukprot:TRINITY_DN43624_c0_g1_i1.p1 TRINITY_DN43624_c0_g1~~TRINITY_DN43624_c0_g1_i1.p1  ORF type:complete len:345 (+),score=68.11 TRINITY_DN43624_c0_g1_i1:66-1037(+)
MSATGQPRARSLLRVQSGLQNATADELVTAEPRRRRPTWSTLLVAVVVLAPFAEVARRALEQQQRNPCFLSCSVMRSCSATTPDRLDHWPDECQLSADIAATTFSIEHRLASDWAAHGAIRGLSQKDLCKELEVDFFRSARAGADLLYFGVVCYRAFSLLEKLGTVAVERPSHVARLVSEPTVANAVLQGYDEETRDAVLSVFLLRLLGYAIFVAWPIIMFVRWILSKRMRRKREEALLVDAAFVEVRKAGQSGVTPQELRFHCEYALEGKVSRTAIHKIWSNPGDPHCLVEAALLADTRRVAVVQHDSQQPVFRWVEPPPGW